MSRGTFRRQIASSEGSRDEEGASGEASEDGEEAGTAGPRGEGEVLRDGATGGVEPLRQQPHPPGRKEEQGRPLDTGTGLTNSPGAITGTAPVRRHIIIIYYYYYYYYYYYCCHRIII